MNRRRLALIGALLVTIIWSSTFVIVKMGLESLGPLTIAGLRYLIGSLVLAPFLMLRRSSRAPVSKKLWPKLILIGISAYTIGNGALFWGLKYIPATTGSFLMSMIPLLVLFGGAILFERNPHTKADPGSIYIPGRQCLVFLFRPASWRAPRISDPDYWLAGYYGFQFTGKRYRSG